MVQILCSNVPAHLGELRSCGAVVVTVEFIPCTVTSIFTVGLILVKGFILFHGPADI